MRFFLVCEGLRRESAYTFRFLKTPPSGLRVDDFNKLYSELLGWVSEQNMNSNDFTESDKCGSGKLPRETDDIYVKNRWNISVLFKDNPSIRLIDLDRRCRISFQKSPEVL